MSHGYIVVIQDNASDHYSYGIPDGKNMKSTIYTSYDVAKAAIQTVSENFDEFLPVAYGKAFPYDSVTFDQELERNSYAPLGWGVINMDGEILRIGIGLLRMPLI